MFRKNRRFLTMRSETKQVTVPADEILSIVSTKKATIIKLNREEQVQIQGDFRGSMWEKIKKGKMINAAI